MTRGEAIEASPIYPEIIGGRLYTKATFFWGGRDSSGVKFYFNAPLDAFLFTYPDISGFCARLGGVFSGIIPSSDGASYSGSCGKTAYGDPDTRGSISRNIECPRNFSYSSFPANNYCTYVCNDPSFVYTGNVTSTDGCSAARDVYEYPKKCQHSPESGNPIMPITGSKVEYLNIGLGIGGQSLVARYDSMGALESSLKSYKYLGEVGLYLKSNSIWRMPFQRKLLLSRSAGVVKALSDAGGIDSFNVATSPPFWSKGNGLSIASGKYFYYNQDNLTVERYGNGEYISGVGSLEISSTVEGMRISAVNSNMLTGNLLSPAPGYVINVNDPFGRSIGFTYRSISIGDVESHVLDQITDPNGQSISLDYDGNANLRTVKWQDGNVRTFVYDSPNANQNWTLTGVIDEANKRYATFVYDSAGWAKSTQHNVDGKAVYAFMVNYDTAPQRVLRFAYDSTNNVMWRYHEWTPATDAFVTQPNGSMVGMAVKSVAGVATSIGGINGGNQVRFGGYSQPAGAGCAASSSKIEYDANGNKALEDDFNGNRTCFVSTGSNEGGAASVPNLLKVKVEGLVGTTGASAGSTPTACSSVTGDSVALPAGSRKTSTQWHPQWALKTREAQPNLITTWVYNGQPDPFNGGATARCVTAKYGSSNHQPKLPDGSDTAVLCKKVEQATTDATGEKGFAATLSTVGDVKQRQWEYTYNQYGQVLTSTDPMGQVTTYTYRCEGQASCDGTNKFAFAGTAPNEVGYYQGDLWKVTNAAGHVTEYVSYDRAGRVLEMKDANGLQTKLSYSPRGWVTEVNTGGLKTIYDYWPTGLLKKSTQPDGSYLYYRYDDAHRLTSVTDQVNNDGNPTGNTVTYTLDNMGNRKTEQLNDATNTITRHIQRDYDALNRLKSISGEGR